MSTESVVFASFGGFGLLWCIAAYCMEFAIFGNRFMNWLCEAIVMIGLVLAVLLVLFVIGLGLTPNEGRCGTFAKAPCPAHRSHR